jgi:membrane protein
MNNNFFNLMKALIELIKAHKKFSFYITLIFLGIIFFFLKLYILTSIILAYITEKILKKYENKMKSTKIARISLFLGFIISIGTIIVKTCINISNNFFLTLIFFRHLFLTLLIIYCGAYFFILYFKYQFKPENFLKTIKESFKLIIFCEKNKYSDLSSELINLIFISSLVVSILIFFVSLFHKIIPDITEIINAHYVLSYFTLLIVKSIDYIKEKILEIE